MHSEFEKNGFLIIRNFFDETTVNLLQSYFNIKLTSINYNEYERCKHKKFTFEDGDVASSSFVYYADHLIESISLNNIKKISNLLGLNLSPTYSFARIYEKGNYLIPHVDRSSCEISATCPVLTYNNMPSTIFISNVIKGDEPGKYSLEEVLKRGEYTQADLHPGDALFYKGCERYHWRDKLESDYLIQFFMHFVQKDGLYKEWIYNKRPYIGHS